MLLRVEREAMKTRDLISTTLSLLVLAACGGSTSGGAPTGIDGGVGAGSANSDITAYQQLAADTRSAASTYRTSMTGASASATDCMSIHDRYDALVRPWVSQMVQMAGEMDGFIDDHGGSTVADMRCTSATMMNELDYHRSIACTFSSLLADQSEATRHADAMNSYAGHVWGRCGEMLGYGAGGCCNWGPMMNGCQDWSATCCSRMMRWDCCGQMMGGGMQSGNCCGDGGDAGVEAGGDPVALGQRVFDSGVGVDGLPIPHTAGVGMGMMNACASCHGLDGHGRQTMMFTAPNVTYANVTDPSGMLEPDGTRGPRYTDDLIRRAVVQGIGGDGVALDTTMPRWQLGEQDWGNLLAFLKTLH